MDNTNNQNVMLEEEESAFDFKQIWTLLVLNWHWILISMMACVLIAFAYLWFTPSTLTVTGKMQIIDKSKSSSSMSAGLAMLNSLPMGLGSSLGGAAGAGSIESEKEIILSNTLVTRVVKDLNLHTEYRLSRWGKETQLYQNNPIEVTLDDAHLAWMDSEFPLYFHQINLTITKDTKGYTLEGQDIPSQTFTTLPATVKTESGMLTLTENKLPERQAKAYEGNYTLKVTVTPPTRAANSFISRTSLEPPSKKKASNIIYVTLTTENLLLGIDYVNHLVEAYNQRANDEKNEEARKTDEFVNERLAKVDAELGSSDAAWENTKKNFQITSPEVDAGDAMAKKSLYEQQLVSIGTELQLHDYLSEYVNNPANLYEIIPVGISANAGSEDAGASGTASLLAQHNTLVNQRKDLLKSVSEMSPQFQRVTQSIQELHPVIQMSLKRDRQAILMRQNTLQREYGRYMGRVGSAPQMERVLTEIGRQREIKQGVYLVMLQKREETAMELANIVDKGKLIDPPAADPGSNKPQKKMVLLVALFLGALLPAGILYLLQMLKTKLDTRSELEAATKLPVLAEIPLNDNGEGIRTARTNLLLNLKEDQKVILVASNSDGDGKSFIASKLEESLAAIGKKALLINGDMRSLSLSHGQHAADILAGSEFASQMADAKSSNDYVILDSPALSQYADAYQLASFADATIYVVKAGQTDKSTIEALANDNRLPNLHLVLNAIDTTTKKYKYLNKK